MKGTDCLRLPEDQWPVQIATQHPEGDMEQRSINAVSSVSVVVVGNVIDPKTFSSWRKLIRVTAWITRIAKKIRARRSGHGGLEGPLTPEEVTKAEISWIRSAQRSLQSPMKNGDFKALSPFIDDKGIIRVGGRVDKVTVSCEEKHEALLPYNHRTSMLIISHMQNNGHPGIATTTAKTRLKYWILKANKLSKAVKFKCNTCRQMARQAKHS